MKREQSRILAVSAILAVSVARVIWRDRLAKIADTKIIVVPEFARLHACHAKSCNFQTVLLNNELFLCNNLVWFRDVSIV
jgi:hypothetical protein